jgi:hypothetical protein
MAKKLTTAKHADRPMDFLGFDGKQYHGRIVRVQRRNWLVFTYYVPGFGEVLNTLDMRKHADRILEVY